MRALADLRAPADIRSGETPIPLKGSGLTQTNFARCRFALSTPAECRSGRRRAVREPFSRRRAADCRRVSGRSSDPCSAPPMRDDPEPRHATSRGYGAGPRQGYAAAVAQHGRENANDRRVRLRHETFASTLLTWWDRRLAGGAAQQQT